MLCVDFRWRRIVQAEIRFSEEEQVLFAFSSFLWMIGWGRREDVSLLFNLSPLFFFFFFLFFLVAEREIGTWGMWGIPWELWVGQQWRKRVFFMYLFFLSFLFLAVSILLLEEWWGSIGSSWETSPSCPMVLHSKFNFPLKRSPSGHADLPRTIIIFID